MEVLLLDLLLDLLPLLLLCPVLLALRLTLPGAALALPPRCATRGRLVALLATLAAGPGASLLLLPLLPPACLAPLVSLCLLLPPQVCMANGYSSMVFDQRIFVSFNP